MKKKPIFKRLAVISGIMAVIMLVYTVKFGYMQLAQADYYRSLSDTTYSQKVSIKAARGEIVDRYGRPLAQNRQSQNVVLNAIYLKNADINTTLLTIINLLKSSGQSWKDELPLTTNNPVEYGTNLSQISDMQEYLGLNDYATAQNCYDALVQKYGLARYSFEEQRNIMGIRYTMDARDFSIANPFTLAEDISDATALKIKELNIPGVQVDIVPVREYIEIDIAPHIIGTIGPIYAEDDWDTLKQKGYAYDDKIGKSGIEQAMEDYLRGQPGIQRVTLDSNNNVVSVVTESEPVAGNTVMLTIDRDLQRVAQDALANMVNSLADKEDSDSHAGAVVVLDVNNFEVLAAATYPSYDMNTYKTNYSELLQNEYNPLYNRALQGVYPPGSTFKPAIALAALQENIITEQTIFNCVHTFRANDMTFSCLGYHGKINVLTALAKSCNYFFFELADRLGINTMNKYCQLMGLGLPTGIEITESSGMLAGPSTRSSWNYGDTIQAAIGQSDNVFTPIQMAAYISTIVNGGTRYSAHLVKEIKSYDMKETVKDDTPTVLNETGFRDDVIATIKKGMLSVSLEGSARSIFSNYPIEVGAKTGTAEISNGLDHGVFIAFAPYDDPEIAIAAVIENGGHGSSVAPLVKEILDQYFFAENEVYNDQQVNTLLP